MLDYRWWVFLHIAGVFGFLLAHGTSATITFRLRRERDRRRIQEMLQLSGSSTRMLYGSLGLLLFGGIGAGIKGHWWSQGWIWISLVLLIVATLAMIAMARPYYRRIGEAVMMRPSGVPRKSDEELEDLLLSSRPLWVAGVGFGALLVILWLMIFKPA